MKIRVSSMTTVGPLIQASACEVELDADDKRVAWAGEVAANIVRYLHDEEPRATQETPDA